MRINSQTSSLTGGASSPGPASSLKGSGATAPSSEDVGGPSAPSEFQALLDQARAVPTDRADRVREVKDRLASGYYHTPDAAARTADAILKANE